MLSSGKRWVALFVIVASFAVSACARPRDENLTAFANSASALSTLAKNAGDLNTEIDSKINLTNSANKFASSGKTDDPDFPPARGKLISGRSDADWKVIEAFLDAISGYAAALAKANDPKLESGLSDKISALGTALSKAAIARDAARGNKLAPIRQQYIQTIGGVVVDVVTIASNIYAGAVIQEAMRDAQPALDVAREPLMSALHVVRIETRKKLDKYYDAITDKLALVSGEGAFIQKYDAYVALNADYSSLQARLDALNGLEKAVDAMIEAHRKLKDDLDNRAALIQFLQTVGDMADKIQKAEDLRKQI